MARIVFSTHLFRYPLGGSLSSKLQYVLGFLRLGHEVTIVERAHYANACYDAGLDTVGDDASYGVRIVSSLLSRFGLGGSWCFQDYRGQVFGMPIEKARAAIGSADVFVDYGNHGAWLDEARGAGVRIYIDGEPGYRQIQLQKSIDAGGRLPDYDLFFTNGSNIGAPDCPAPTAGASWRTLFHPVNPGLFRLPAAGAGAPFTTVMNWRSHAEVEFRGQVYGQKNAEFEKFMRLPRRVSAPLEVAVSGGPVERLREAGWSVADAHRTTLTFDAFRGYIGRSAGEFAVAKNVFVAMRTGWFSDRSAAYLAAGRPVVMQDTGFGAHLPTGEGLFAVRDEDEATEAIERIARDYRRHALAARRIARDRLRASEIAADILRAARVQPVAIAGRNRSLPP